jgi:hypothetical protein
VSDNSAARRRILGLAYRRGATLDRRKMKAMKALRNILGTAGILFAGYIFIASMKDMRRYIRINTM